jgi:hypothetical protein
MPSQDMLIADSAQYRPCLSKNDHEHLTPESVQMTIVSDTMAARDRGQYGGYPLTAKVPLLHGNL